MKRLTVILTLALCLVVVGSASAQLSGSAKSGPVYKYDSPLLNRAPTPQNGLSPFCSEDTPVTIDPDGAPTTSTISPGASFSITDLDVSVLIAHSWVGDLNADLSGPCAVQLFNRIGDPGSGLGCSSDDIDATLDDEAGSNVEDQCNADAPAVGPGSFIPGPGGGEAGDLEECDGENIGQDWTITLTDNALGDTGTLVEWCLITTPVPVELQEFSID